jgi:hypothetical protein
MEERLRKAWPHRVLDAEEKRRIGTALRQLEWADTYLNAVVSLELEDHPSRLAVAELRSGVTALELRLRKLLAG